MTREEDIREVVADEQSRGRRRPKDPQSRRQERELLHKFRKALEFETEAEFLEAIRELHFGDDPVKLRNALRIWRAHVRGDPRSD